MRTKPCVRSKVSPQLGKKGFLISYAWSRGRGYCHASKPLGKGSIRLILGDADTHAVRRGERSTRASKLRRIEPRCTARRRIQEMSPGEMDMVVPSAKAPTSYG